MVESESTRSVGGGRRLAVLGLICGACTLLMAAFWHVLPPSMPWLRGLSIAELWYHDRVMEVGKKAPLRDDLVFLAIDESSLAVDQVSDEEVAASRALQLMLGGWPWPREVHGLAVEKLVGAGARAVVFDLFFPGPGEGDDAFMSAMERHAERVVIGGNFGQGGVDYAAGGFTAYLLPSETLVPHKSPVDPRIGYVNFWPDEDDRVRRIFLNRTIEEVNGQPRRPDSEILHSLTAAALRQAGQGDPLPSDTRDRMFRFSRLDADLYPPRSYYSIFVDALWDANFAGGESFRDKIVVVGASAAVLQDSHLTPFGRTAGPQIHMNAMAAALNGEFYRYPPRVTGLLMILGAGLLAWALVTFLRRPFLVILLLAAGGYLLFFGTVWLYNAADLMLPSLAPLVCLGFGGVVTLSYDFARERRDKLRTRRTLERYVSKDIVEAILDQPGSYLDALGGVRKQVTILFSDLRGFTATAEQADPAELVAQLNEYLGAMVDCVQAHDGSVDKFIGDAIMAVWGSVHTAGDEGDALHAVHTAVAMREELARLNRGWEESGARTFRFGIGINQGTAIFGNIGSEKKMDPTVIGDPVNLAARLESITKKYRCDIVVSQNIAELAAAEFVLRSIERVRVVGKKEPVDIFSVVGRRDALPEDSTELVGLHDYEDAVVAFRESRFEAAEHLFRHALEQRPDDFLCGFYINCCKEYRKLPPPPDWGGVTVLDSK